MQFWSGASVTGPQEPVRDQVRERPTQSMGLLYLTATSGVTPLDLLDAPATHQTCQEQCCF